MYLTILIVRAKARRDEARRTRERRRIVLKDKEAKERKKKAEQEAKKATPPHPQSFTCFVHRLNMHANPNAHL